MSLVLTSADIKDEELGSGNNRCRRRNRRVYVVSGAYGNNAVESDKCGVYRIKELPDMSETATKEIHAHVCMNCANQRKNSIWVHGAENAGVIGTHVCPECGHIEWRKIVLQSGQLPQAQGKAGTNYDMLLGYIVLAVALALVGYCAFLYIKKAREGKIEIAP